MAKADKKIAKKEKPVEKEAAAPEFKYGVKDLAEELGIKETSVRVQLRNKGIEKSGKSYGSIAAALTAEGVPTAQGGRWHAATVKKIHETVAS